MSRRKSYEFQDAPAQGKLKVWRSLEELEQCVDHREIPVRESAR